MNESEMKNLRMKVVEAIVEKLFAAVEGDFEVHLKNPAKPFAYQKLVTYIFDGFEIEFFIWLNPHQEGSIRFINSAHLPDGRSYEYKTDLTLPNPLDLFMERGGKGFMLTEYLTTAK